MRRLRPALAVTAALTLTAAAAPALGSPSASTTTAPTGAAQSSLTLLDLALANHDVRLGTLAGVAETTKGRVAQIVVTPAELDGTTFGQQTVTPSNAPATVDGSGKSVSIPSVLDATGPTFGVDAQSSPTAVITSAVLKALGSVTLKPAGLVALPLDLTATTLDNVAKVTDTQAESSKTVVIGNLSLPSVDTLLGSLGVNVPALLQQLSQQALTTLGNLVGAQGLAALNTAVDAAQAKVQNAADTLAGASSALAPAQSAVTSAQGVVTTATNTLNTANSAWTSALTSALGLPVVGPLLSAANITTSTTPTAYLNAVSGNSSLSVQSLVDAANAVVNAQTALNAANTALAAAQAVVANIQALIDALQALVNGVLSSVTGNSNPLATLGNITVTTKAVTSATSTPTPVAQASVGTLKILGSDSVPSQLTSALGGVLNTLAGVLNSVTGVKFTPPAIAIGTGKTATSTSGATRQATASITGLTLTLPTLQLPTQLSTVTSAIPDFATVSNGVTSVLGGKVDIATLAESASMTPGTTASTPNTPGSTTSSPSTPTQTTSSPSTPSLAKTGLTTALPLTAALLILAALAVAHRRRSSVELDG